LVRQSLVRQSFPYCDSDQMQERLETEGLDVMDYEDRWGRYRIRLSKGDIKKHAEFLTMLLAEAHGVE
jgi:hypothetical protein